MEDSDSTGFPDTFNEAPPVTLFKNGDVEVDGEEEFATAEDTSQHVTTHRRREVRICSEILVTKFARKPLSSAVLRSPFEQNWFDFPIGENQN